MVTLRFKACEEVEKEIAAEELARKSSLAFQIAAAEASADPQAKIRTGVQWDCDSTSFREGC